MGLVIHVDVGTVERGLARNAPPIGSFALSA
jgi:hypothetical protein